VTPEDLSASIDGASTSWPGPAVLVNLVEGEHVWWRTRATIAHELCHLILDHRDANQPAATLSPQRAREEGITSVRMRRLELFEGFDLIERRANAFAAHFLAPTVAVRQVVGDADPASEEAIARIGSTFGVGRITAVNRLAQVFGLSQSSRRFMILRAARHWNPEAVHPDATVTVGLRAGVLQDAAMSAFAEGKIDAVRVREHLRLPFTEPLPEHPLVTDAQRRPLRKVEDTVRALAQQYLEDELRSEDVAGPVARTEAGWRASVLRDGQGDTVGAICVSFDRRVQGFISAEA
jgi:hypothetical protein